MAIQALCLSEVIQYDFNRDLNGGKSFAAVTFTKRVNNSLLRVTLSLMRNLSSLPHE